MHFRCGSFACELSLRSFRLVTSACVISLGNFRLEFFVWELLLGISSLGDFHLGSFAWELSLGNFRLGPQPWGTGLLKLGEPADGHWGNPGGPAPATCPLRC